MLFITSISLANWLKRSESYRNNEFDPSTSIAHFYQIDSTENIKIQERIFSYDKEFLDEYVYEYDEFGDLSSIRRTNNDGTDVTQVEHKKFKGEYTVTYLLNDVPLKTVRTSTQKPKGIIKKEYIYQYDMADNGNWIKQIVIPDNTYTTRKITYYTPEIKIKE